MKSLKLLWLAAPLLTLAAAATAQGPAKPAVKVADVKPSANPKVAPGKVKWHTDFAAARKAAEQSGKPVLLFQLLGRLDEEFA